jgi:hypothetical protein
MLIMFLKKIKNFKANKTLKLTHSSSQSKTEDYTYK